MVTAMDPPGIPYFDIRPVTNCSKGAMAGTAMPVWPDASVGSRIRQRQSLPVQGGIVFIHSPYDIGSGKSAADHVDLAVRFRQDLTPVGSRHQALGDPAIRSGIVDFDLAVSHSAECVDQAA